LPLPRNRPDRHGRRRHRRRRQPRAYSSTTFNRAASKNGAIQSGKASRRRRGPTPSSPSEKRSRRTCPAAPFTIWVVDICGERRPGGHSRPWRGAAPGETCTAQRRIRMPRRCASSCVGPATLLTQVPHGSSVPSRSTISGSPRPRTTLIDQGGSRRSVGAVVRSDGRRSGRGGFLFVRIDLAGWNRARGTMSAG
jgi:hypothetical protein